jgi:hypothetical protein
MNAEAQNPPPQHKRRWQKWLWAALVVVLGVFVLVRLPGLREPAYAGKKVSEWFNEAANMPPHELYGSEAWRAFEEMEGDAVPFLVRCLRARPSPLQNLYVYLYPIRPTRVSRFLPRPRLHLYQNRRMCALRLLGQIGVTQRFKAADGELSKKPSVALALPAMEALLKSGDEHERASVAAAAMYMGHLAAPLVPGLVELVRTPGSGFASVQAVEALGLIGPPASSAAGALIQWATNDPSHAPVFAAQSLGDIGPSARPAVPLLSLMLTNRICPFPAARALAEIGVVPDEALPALLAMKEGTDTWERCAATLALGRHDPRHRQLQAQVVALLRSTNRTAVLLSLGRMGTNAAVFAPEVRRMVGDTGIVGRFAKRTLRQIQPPAQ